MKHGEKRRIDGTGLSLDEMGKAMQEVPSDEMSFEINRSTAEPSRTFSKPALDELLGAVQVFIAARIAGHMEGEEFAKVGHVTARVDVRVTVDGETWTVSDDLKPWYRIDGTVRAGALDEAHLRARLEEHAKGLKR